jgi:hypothetical protein
MELLNRPARSLLTGALLVALAALALLAAPADARLQATHATTHVQRWHSKREFRKPYAYVDVIHNGRVLPRAALTRCKGQYADRDLTVQISTCGKRWRVRAVYVSLHSKREHFRIKYFPRGNPRQANFRTSTAAPAE